MNYIAHQAPLSMGFQRQEYWSRLPFPPPCDPPMSLASPSLAGRLFNQATREAKNCIPSDQKKKKKKGFYFGKLIPNLWQVLLSEIKPQNNTI